jgi:Holliday junction resolvase RusA-like endonuclease
MDDRKWRVKIPGQPPSMNHMYKEATQTARDKWGAPVYWKDGRPKTYRTKVKADGVQTYQDSVTWYTKAAMPSGWEPFDRVRLRYWYHLKRDIDGDNAQKAINDAIAHGLRIDDKTFLTTVVAKWTGEKDPFVVVEVENEREPVHDDSHHQLVGSAGHR